MDAKFLAKSKRAHSQHQSKKNHPNAKSKAPMIASSADGNSKKPSGNQTREKSRQFHSSPSTLPTNWDRYEEEFPSGAEELSVGSTSRTIDVVVPKSKGADFAHLISEAQSQLQLQSSLNSDVFASIDNFLTDFNQGASSMLSVRGNRILSWIGDDNFIVDDNSTVGYEAPFLSMDLHSLAAQLAKLDISERLFIEADILPPELHADSMSNETISKESEQAETCAIGADAHFSDEFSFLGQADVEKNVDPKGDVMASLTISNCGSFPSYSHHGTEKVDQRSQATPSSITRSGSSVPGFPCEGAQLIKDDSLQLEQTDLGVVDSLTQFSMNAVVNSKEKKTSAAFEALAAEAELDMLLNSLGETKLVDPYGTSKKLPNGVPVVQLDNSTTFLDGPSVYTSSQPFGQGSSSSKSVHISVDLDDTIDNLLAEAPNLKNHQDAVFLNSLGETKLVDPYGTSKKLPNGVPVVQLDNSTTFLDGPSVYTSSQPFGQGSSSSKSVHISVDLDDTIDNLLAEAPNLKNHQDAVFLNSLGETKLVDPYGTSKKLPNGVPVVQLANSTTFFDGPSVYTSSQPFGQGSSSSKSVHSTVDLDDTIDNLLAEVPNLKNHQDAVFLNSLGETKLVDPYGTSKKLPNGVPVVQLDNSTTFLDGPSVYKSSQPFGQGSSSSKSVRISVDLDDTIDNLLAEAPNLKNHQDAVFLNSLGETKLVDPYGTSKKLPNGVPVVQLDNSTTFLDGPSVYASSQPFGQGSSSSKNVHISVDLDDTIDNLLAPNLKNHQDAMLQKGGRDVPPVVPSISTKVLDDFDSWLDTI